jgi:O-antigen/teichoic acid export membrane protein
VGLPPVARPPLRRSLIGSVLTGILGQATVVVSGVLVARMLTVHDRGVVALVAVVPLILMQVGTLGVPRAITFEAARRGGSAGSALSTAIPVASIQILGILSVGIATAALVSAGRPDVGPVAFLGLAYVPFGVVSQYGLAALQGLGSYRTFNLIRLTPAVSYATFALIFFALGGASVTSLIVSWVSSGAVGAVLVLVAVRPELRVERANARHHDASPPPTGYILRFGVRSLVGSLSPLGSMGLDQVIVGLALSPAVLGLYVVASSICNLPQLVAQSFGVIAYPHLASLSGEPQGRAIVRLVVTTSLVSGLVVAALELAAGLIIPLFFGPAYSQAVPLARVLLLAAFLFGIGRVLSDSLQGAGHLLAGTASEAVAWLTLSVLLAILWNSLDGVRFATALTLAAGANLLTLMIIAFVSVGGSRHPAKRVRVREEME